MSDTPALRTTRRPWTPTAHAEASLYSDDLIGGFSVYGGRAFRLRGTALDPLDTPSALPGRQSDILWNGEAFPVVSNYTLEESQRATGAMVARYEAIPGRVLRESPEWGCLVLHGPIKVLHRVCRHCGEPFKSWRFATQRRRWATFCSADHRQAFKRVTDRQRIRKKRRAG